MDEKTMGVHQARDALPSLFSYQLTLSPVRWEARKAEGMRERYLRSSAFFRREYL